MAITRYTLNLVAIQYSQLQLFFNSTSLYTLVWNVPLGLNSTVSCHPETSARPPYTHWLCISEQLWRLHDQCDVIGSMGAPSTLTVAMQRQKNAINVLSSWPLVSRPPQSSSRRPQRPCKEVFLGWVFSLMISSYHMKQRLSTVGLRVKSKCNSLYRQLSSCVIPLMVWVSTFYQTKAKD